MTSWTRCSLGEQIIFIPSELMVAPGGSVSPNSIYITNVRVLLKDLHGLWMKADVLLWNYKGTQL